MIDGQASLYEVLTQVYLYVDHQDDLSDREFWLLHDALMLGHRRLARETSHRGQP